MTGICLCNVPGGMCLDTANLNYKEPGPNPKILYYNQSYQQVDYLTPCSGAGNVHITVRQFTSKPQSKLCCANAALVRK